MFQFRQAPTIAALACLICCGPRLPSESSADDSPEPDELALACESLCARVFDCSTQNFASNWGFEDETGCVSECQHASEATVEFTGNPDCLVYAAELWSCGGAIQNCQVFEAFDQGTFGLPAQLENPCQTQEDQLLSHCN